MKEHIRTINIPEPQLVLPWNKREKFVFSSHLWLASVRDRDNRLTSTAYGVTRVVTINKIKINIINIINIINVISSRRQNGGLV